MKPITGPFLSLGKQAQAKREHSHKAAELRMMSKELALLADKAFSFDCPIMGETILTAAGMARDMATLTENS